MALARCIPVATAALLVVSVLGDDSCAREVTELVTSAGAATPDGMVLLQGTVEQLLRGSSTQAAAAAVQSGGDQLLSRSASTFVDVVEDAAQEVVHKPRVLAILMVAGIVVLVTGWAFRSHTGVLAALCCAGVYVMLSTAMIETNKWLMMPGHFPYPIVLTSYHMLLSAVLANILRFIYPAAFTALPKVEVTPRFCANFVPMGAAFALSIVCGNAAYQYMSVSVLQIMKQSNVVIIYLMSILCGLEALRRCHGVLLAVVLCGTLSAIHGELHGTPIGVALQVTSSLSEAFKIIIQGKLMSGSARLDPLTLVLFMAPACLLAILAPLVLVHGGQVAVIGGLFLDHWVVLLVNGLMAFLLNVLIAVCIKLLNPVGFLLCGIVKDVCIVTTSAFLLGESLAPMQVGGFTLALLGVSCYGLYKQNLDCFQDDHLLPGFRRVFMKLSGSQETTRLVPKGAAAS